MFLGRSRPKQANPTVKPLSEAEGFLGIFGLIRLINFSQSRGLAYEGDFYPSSYSFELFKLLKNRLINFFQSKGLSYEGGRLLREVLQ